MKMNEKLSRAYARRWESSRSEKRRNCQVNGRESLKKDLRKERQQKHLIGFLMKQTIVKLFNSSERKKKDFSILI
jgi:hypothetical protein